jgi:beta-1,4-N-acetylglucosaminyltransferase
MPGYRLTRYAQLSVSRRVTLPSPGVSRVPSVLLVCSPGGHLLQMLSLEPAWHDCDTTWVTLPAADVDHLLADRDVVMAHGPTNRSLSNLVRNLRLAWRVVRGHRPEVILSTGAGLAVPFFAIGRLHGCRLVYVESLTRTQGLSLSGRIAYPLAHEFFVQWPGTAPGRRRARHEGSLL